MIYPSNATTDFYHPDKLRALSESGAFLVLTTKTGHYGTYALVSPTGEAFLTGNTLWLEKVARKYGIRVQVLSTWFPLEEGHHPGVLYQTEFGARTLADGLSMLALRKEQPVPTSSVNQVDDNYTNAEDTFIEQNGMSSGLS